MLPKYHPVDAPFYTLSIISFFAGILLMMLTSEGDWVYRGMMGFLLVLFVHGITRGFVSIQFSKLFIFLGICTGAALEVGGFFAMVWLVGGFQNIAF